MENYIGKIVSPFNENESIDFVRLSISNEIIEIEFSSSKRSHSNIKTIIGVFNGFGKVTLVNCQNIGMSTGAGADVKKYSAEYLFKGEFINNPESYYFDRVNIEMSGLLDWTKISSINNNLFTDKVLTIEDIDIIEIYKSDDLSIEIFSSNNINFKRENNQITIKENVGFKIKSQNCNINIWDYLHLIKELKKILFIFSNRNTHIDKTNFYKGKEPPVKLYWFGNNSLGAPSPMNPRINFEDIKPDLSNIIHNWFENKDLHTSVELVLEKSINNKLSRENYFLNNCFSIETFHRRFKNYKLFDKVEFKSIKEGILESIEKSDIKELIGNNLAHINEPNFKKRLYDFQSDFSKLLPSDWNVEEYITRIVKTRNYLVHRSSNKKVFEKFDLLYASIFIETIIKINVYRTLGIKEGLIEKLLSDTGKNIKGFYDSNKRMRF
ncbi:MAG: HEPN domain-containing protein [Cellulophaga sp.]|uniref:ApeA N-terminal domain 1-containing protein n=1 Tax=Cellulophaga sp. TaxID=1972202 RepID=UPI003266CE6C